MEIENHQPQQRQRSARACIVGAGTAGLAAAKALKDQGVSYDHFEMTENVGGLWCPENERSAAYKNLTLITSKERTAFSDHPMPEAVADYGHHTDMRSYLESYAARFELESAITFDTKITHAAPDQDGGWVVRTKEGRSARYESLLVCNGHHWNPRRPAFCGAFDGGERHVRDYWSPETFAEQRVLVVGVGNSGVGVAVDLCEEAEDVTLSSRSDTWVVPKYLLGRPVDMWGGPMRAYVPFWMNRLVFRTLLFLTIGRQQSYGVPVPKGRGPLEENPTLSEKLLPYVRNGEIEMKPNVERLEGGDVRFEDGSSKPFDQIIYATGYRISCPFLPEEVFEATENETRLYRHVVHPDVPNLYFIGLIQPAGANAPLSELQSKWVARLLAGKSDLPSREVMHQCIQESEEARAARYHKSASNTLLVDFWDYALKMKREAKQ